MTATPGSSGASSSAGSDAAAGVGTFDGAVDAASSCQASDVQTYVPPATYQPAAAPSSACIGVDGGQLYETFYEDCLGPSNTKAACAGFEQNAVSTACASCVLTPYTAQELGPILDYGGYVGGNVPGCIELTAPTPTNLSCATAVQALSDCELAACQANCPVSDSASLAARQECGTSADKTGCDSYFDATSAACTMVPDGGLAAACMDTMFKDFYDAVVPLFCARVAVADAGSPEGDAAAPELDAAAGDAGGLSPDGGRAVSDAAAILDAGRD